MHLRFASIHCVITLPLFVAMVLDVGNPPDSILKLLFSLIALVPPHSAMGLDVGTPLRLMGVQVGVVKAVRSALENVEAVVQVPQK